ncbi:carbohydrate ABC transporter permease [Leifsonia sp. NPDC058194]|uniref:carbohydrate ABC transporter permease n=1 Tax=Leifsonia sp. NPDC058194 TaxID=3346374 RepID=UPI0036DBCA46
MSTIQIDTAEPSSRPTSPRRNSATTARKRRRPRRTAGGFLARFGVHIAVLIIVAVWVLPIIGLLVSSFRTGAASAVGGWWTFLNDAGLTTEAYRKALVEGQMARGTLNSFLITIPTNVILVAISAVTAYAFSTMNFRGKNAIFLLIVGMLAMPAQVALAPLFSLFTSIGLSGQFASVWIFQAGFGLPLGLLVLRTYFDSIPSSLHEAALIDGASMLTTFIRVILPISLPALASVLIMQFITAWNDLLAPLVFLGGGQNAPTTVLIAALANSETSDTTTTTAAAALISLVIPLAVFLFLQRYYSRGMTAGATKG